MFNPSIWHRFGVPIIWSELPEYILKNRMWDVLTAVENHEIELMFDYDDKIHWRRNILDTPKAELGL